MPDYSFHYHNPERPMVVVTAKNINTFEYCQHEYKTDLQSFHKDLMKKILYKAFISATFLFHLE